MEGEPKSTPEGQRPDLEVAAELRAPEGSEPVGFTLSDGGAFMTAKGLAAAADQYETDQQNGKTS